MSQGIAYIVESFIAVLVLFIFAIGIQSTPQGQDWSDYSQQVEAQDLTEVAETTGALQALEQGKTGNFRTFAQHVSGGDLSVSGSVNIPIQDFSVAFPILRSQRQIDDLQNISESSEACSSRELDIENESGPILTPEEKRFNARLYIADTNPRSASRREGVDYDTLYIDNGSDRCQFDQSDGPFFVDDFFNYTNNSQGASFQFKQVTNDDQPSKRKLVYHNASQIVELRDPAKRDVNGIETSLSFDTVNLSESALADYDLVVFRRNESLEQINDPDNLGRLRSFSDRGGSMLLMMNLSKEGLRSSSLLDSTDLSWVSEMEIVGSKSADALKFSNSKSSRSLQEFFMGIGDSDLSDAALPTPGKISSATGNGTAVRPLLAYENVYNPNGWNASDFSMDSPGSVPDGAPESECYPPPDDSLKKGSLRFPGGGSAQYDVLNAELGATDTFCQGNDLRSLMIDFDNDGSFEPQNGEGPFVDGDDVEWRGRSYTPNFLDSGGVELEFNGSTDQEVVNYVPYRSGTIAIVSYRQEYSEPQRRLLVSIIYQSLPSNSVFGTGGKSAFVDVLSSANEDFYMPYRAKLRWGRE